MPQYLMSQSDSRVVVRNYEGQMFSYPEPAKYASHDPAQCSFCAQQQGRPKVGVAATLTPGENGRVRTQAVEHGWPTITRAELPVGVETGGRR